MSRKLANYARIFKGGKCCRPLRANLKNEIMLNE